MNKEIRKKCLQLELEYKKAKLPGYPENYLCLSDWKVNNSNSLTKYIIYFLKINGYQAERISCTGRYIDQSYEYTDVVGFRRRIGTGTWIKSSMTKGTSDISAIIKGIAIKIEVKWNKDKVSKEQLEYKQQVENSGGIYLIIRTFEEFYEWFINYNRSK